MDCISAIPWHTQKGIHNFLSCTRLIVHNTPSFFFPVTSPLRRAYLPTGRRGKSHRTSLTHVAQTARSLFPTCLPSSWPLSSALCFSVPPQLSHLLARHSASTHLAFIRTDARGYAALHTWRVDQIHFHSHAHTHQHVSEYMHFHFPFFFF